MSDSQHLDNQYLDLQDEYIKKFHLKTVMSSKEIYFWDPVKGIYQPNADILIGRELEADYVSQLEEFKKETIGMMIKQIKDSGMLSPEPWTKKAIDEFI